MLQKQETTKQEVEKNIFQENYQKNWVKWWYFRFAGNFDRQIWVKAPFFFGGSESK